MQCFRYRARVAGEAEIEVMILVSKTAGRYRLQSPSLPALWLVTSELVSRLRRHFKEGLALSVLEDPPLLDLFAAVDKHLASRHEVPLPQTRPAKLSRQSPLKSVLDSNS